MLSGRCVVLGVTGGIAAYKAVYLASALCKLGAEVRVVMTDNAREFITPLTFESVTHRPVVTGTFTRTEEFDVEHVGLAQAADIFIVAPATANFLAKAASGVADDMLTTTYLAAKCVKVLAPAMNTAMYEDETVTQNIRELTSRGVFVMPPCSGWLACGDVGTGRMAEPDDIIAFALDAYKKTHSMAGLRVLVNAGPTREYIDPVRFLSNPSTGKMGYAIAREAVRRGAQVTLISGPVALKAPTAAETVRVTSAQQMYDACMEAYPNSDIVIATAAVSDYAPETVSDKKLKKGGNMTLTLKRTPDILKSMGQIKTHQFLVGFAAETNDVEAYARGKLSEKHADMIVANDVTEKGAGFAADTNAVTIYDKSGSQSIPLCGKDACAAAILDLLTAAYKENGRNGESGAKCTHS